MERHKVCRWPAHRQRNQKQSSSMNLGLIGIILISIVLQINSTTASDKREISQEKDFAPKLVHQPASVELEPHQPHAVECPVESRPESDVKWFKDDEPLDAQQIGAELMFLSVTDDDAGDYRCRATNYLGSVTSERFRLTVKSSVYDERVRLEPVTAEVNADQRAEFTCSILSKRDHQQKTTTTTANNKKLQVPVQPEVSWRRNGKLLKQVAWLDEGSASDALSHEKYVARVESASEFVLSISGAQVKEDDNATFSCLIHNLDQLLVDDPTPSDGSKLARESNLVRLRVSRKQVTNLDVHLAPAIADLGTSPQRPNELRPNQTTDLNQLDGPATPASGNQRRAGATSLREALNDLYELAKPTLVLLGLFSLVALIVGLQLLVIRRGKRHENRYMKHQGYHSGSSAGSGASAGIGACQFGSANHLDCDPVLSSFLQRTLSAPSGATLDAGANGSKTKYRSYRDHMRKVAAANTNELVVGSGDLVDGVYFAAQMQHQQLNHHHHQDNQPLSLNVAALPNLYNQSLAAREQARSLLRQNEHMRSLSNLNQKQQQQQQQFSQQHAGQLIQNGSHLNLPLSFAFGAPNPSGGISSRVTVEQQQQNSRSLFGDAGQQQLVSGSDALLPPHWPSQLVAGSRRVKQREQQRQHDEHYQLVNCSSISPSSSSADDNSNSGSAKNQSRGPARPSRVQRQSSSLNHYSTIETNDDDDDQDDDDAMEADAVDYADDDDRYEELDCRLNLGADVSANQNTRTSTFVTTGDKSQTAAGARSTLRASFMSNSGNSSSSGCGTSSSMSGNGNNGETNLSSLVEDGIRPTAKNAAKTNRKQNHSASFQDQLSPYAVSSICTGPTKSSAKPSLPPVNASEAMRALNEQFDINRLMLMDEVDPNCQLPFNPPPPPPPPPPETKRRAQ